MNAWEEGHGCGGMGLGTIAMGKCIGHPPMWEFVPCPPFMRVIAIPPIRHSHHSHVQSTAQILHSSFLGTAIQNLKMTISDIEE